MKVEYENIKETIQSLKMGKYKLILDLNKGIVYVADNPEYHKQYRKDNKVKWNEYQREYQRQYYKRKKLKKQQLN